MTEYNGGIDTNSLLLARGVGGYGGYGMGGFGGGGMGGYGTHGANGAFGTGANAVRIDAHSATHAAGLENLLDQNQFQTTNKNIVDGFSRASDTSTANVNRVADNQFRAELRGSDQVAASLAVMNDMRSDMAKCCCETQKTVAEAAKEAAACCCEAKLQACKDHGDLKALVIEQNSMTRALMTTTALDSANAKIIQLETINALTPRHHG
jgi:hypothetical protein